MPNKCNCFKTLGTITITVDLFVILRSEPRALLMLSKYSH
jgi:hypothetical protein